MQIPSLKSPSHPSYGFLAFSSLGLKVDSVLLIYLACPVLLPALVMVLLAVGSLALHVFSLASNMLTGLILTYKHASGVVNDQLGQALMILWVLGLNISDLIIQKHFLPWPVGTHIY